jgi:hypothetical protein
MKEDIILRIDEKRELQRERERGLSITEIEEKRSKWILDSREVPYEYKEQEMIILKFDIKIESQRRGRLFITEIETNCSKWINNSREVPDEYKQNVFKIMEKDIARMINEKRELQRERERGLSITEMGLLRSRWINWSKDIPEYYKQNEFKIMKEDIILRIDEKRELQRERERGLSITEIEEKRSKWILDSKDVPETYKNDEFRIMKEDIDIIPMIDEKRELQRERERGLSITEIETSRLEWIDNSKEVPEKYKVHEMIILEKYILNIKRELQRERERERGLSITEIETSRSEWINNSENVPNKYKENEMIILNNDIEKIHKDIKRWKDKGFPGQAQASGFAKRDGLNINLAQKADEHLEKMHSELLDLDNAEKNLKSTGRSITEFLLAGKTRSPILETFFNEVFIDHFLDSAIDKYKIALEAAKQADQRL